MKGAYDLLLKLFLRAVDPFLALWAVDYIATLMLLRYLYTHKAYAFVVCELLSAVLALNYLSASHNYFCFLVTPTQGVL